MRNIVVVLLSFAISAMVAATGVSLVKTCGRAQAQQGALPLDTMRTRPDGWKTVPAYELDDVWTF